MSVMKELIPYSTLIAQGDTLTIKRYSNWTYIKGRPQADKCEDFQIKGSVQPLTGRELLKLEEGERDKEHLNDWTKGDIRKKDQVAYQGVKYEVQFD